MADAVHSAFDDRLLELALGVIVPAHAFPEKRKSTPKFKQIRVSIEEVGLIEPLVVAPPREGLYLLLDGHSRLEILRDTRATHIKCLIATDDESFTYNKRISHLATIQEHRMIVRALEKGVPEQRLSKALSVDVAHIRRLRSMLDGICSEAIEKLKEQRVNAQAFRIMRRMKPVRQIEVADLMLTANNYSGSYVDLLFIGTRQKDLLHPEKAKKLGGLTDEQIAKMQREMEAVSDEFRNAEEAYGRNVFDLVLARGYVGKLLRNEEITMFLSKAHPEIYEGLKAMVDEAPFDTVRPRSNIVQD